MSSMKRNENWNQKSRWEQCGGGTICFLWDKRVSMLHWKIIKRGKGERRMEEIKFLYSYKSLCDNDEELLLCFSMLTFIKAVAMA